MSDSIVARHCEQRSNSLYNSNKDMSIVNLTYPFSEIDNQHTLGIIIKDVLQELWKEILVIDSKDLNMQNEWSTIRFEKIRGGIYYLYNLLYWENYNKLSPEIIQRIEEFTYNSKNQESTTYNLMGILESWKKWNL